MTITYDEDEIEKTCEVNVTVYFENDGYYIVGVDADWGDDSYKMILNESALSTEYMYAEFEVDGVDDAIKIVGQFDGVLSYHGTLKDGVNEDIYSFDEDDNIELIAGKYDIYFTVDGSEQGIWISEWVAPQEKTLSSIIPEYIGDGIVVGDTVTEADFKVTAFYTDSTNAEVDGFTISAVSTYDAGTQSVKVTYEEDGVKRTANISVTVLLPEDGYYILGIDGNWGTTTYKMILNEAAQATEYMYTELLIADEDDEIKIVCQADGVLTYYNTLKNTVDPEIYSINEYSENIILVDGTYDIYFTVDGLDQGIWIGVSQPEEEPGVKTLSSISAVYGKEALIVGNEINVEAITVTATYSDESTAPITEFTVEEYDYTSVGMDREITISYTENEISKTCTITVDVLFAEDGCYILGMDENWGTNSFKMTLNEGADATEYMYLILEAEDDNDAIKIVIQADGELTYYSNLKTGIPSGIYTQETADSNIVLLEGTYNIYFTVDGLDQGIWIEKFVRVLDSITAQYVGEPIAVGGELDKAQIIVDAHYTNAPLAAIIDFEMSGFDSLTAGIKEVTISYTENGVNKQCIVNVTVVEAEEETKTLVSIEAEYIGEDIIVGGELDKAQFIVEATYDDASTAPVTEFMVTGFDSSTAGVKTVTIAYTENEVERICTVQVTVVEAEEEPKTLVSIDAELIKESIIVNGELNKEDIIVTATYDDASNAEVTNFTIGEFDNASVGMDRTVTISYTENGTDQTCTVAVDVLFEEDGCYILGMNENWGTTTYKMTLNEGNIEETEYMFTELVAADDNDAIKIVIQADGMLTYYCTLKADIADGIYTQETADSDIVLLEGTYDIYFTVGGEKEGIWIQVSQPEGKVLTGITAGYIGAPIYVDGTLDTSKITVTATYSDTTIADVDTFTVSELDSSSVGTKTLTVTYIENEVEETCTVNVKVIFEEDGYYILGMDEDWGTTEYKMVKNLKNTTATEYMYTELVAADDNDAIKIVSQIEGELTYYSNLKADISSTICTQETADSDIVLKAGTYDIYFTLDGDNKGIWIAVSQPGEGELVPTDYYIRGIDDDWATGIAMFVNPGDENEVMYKGLTVDGVESFKIYYNENWYANVDVEDGISYTGGNGSNIVLAAGTYDLYFKKNTNSLWVEKTVVE